MRFRYSILAVAAVVGLAVAAGSILNAGDIGGGFSGGGSSLSTPVSVANGGTGATTLTDGGVLLGSAAAITAMSVLADGEMVVGDGTTDPVAESGATLRTSIGVGTGDNVTFTNLTLTGTASVDDTFTSQGISDTANQNVVALSDAVAAVTGALTVTGSASVDTFTSAGIDDNSTLEALDIDASGFVTMPQQSAFLALALGAQNDVTGNTTAYTMIFSTERFDKNSDFDGTSTFTAPVTGIYHLDAQVQMSGTTTAAAQYDIHIITSNATYTKRIVMTDLSNANDWGHSLSIAADMDAADTATVTVTIFGEAGDVADVNVGANHNFFSGVLLN
tara:strand:- start:1842 stop:2840 length:999 start_codon:yes stop_codon:yes gene_type:complete